MSVPANKAPAGRHIGVMKAQSQEATREERATGKKNTLLSFAPGQMYALQYTDEQGLAQDPVVVFEAGGIFYMPPNAQQWTKELRPLADWLQKELGRRMAAAKAKEKAPEAPTTDNVDVMAGG